MKDNIKVIIYFSIFVIFMIVSYIGYGILSKNQLKEISEKQEKEKLQEFDLYLENGDKISSKELIKDKPIIINVWTSWCAYCDVEMEFFNELYLKEKDNVVFIMINATGDRDSKDSAKEYIKSRGYSFDIYYDLNLDALESLEVYSYPTTIFVDKAGFIDSKVVGTITKQMLENKISSLK